VSDVIASGGRLQIVTGKGGNGILEQKPLGRNVFATTRKTQDLPGILHAEVCDVML
jgi:hypothetical protein